MQLTPKTEIDERIAKFQVKLSEQEYDGAIIILNSDMYYFTGTVQNSHLWVPAEGDPVLMIRKSLRRGREECPLERIVPMRSPKDIPEILNRFGYTKFDKIGLELDVLPVNNFATYQKLFSDSRIADISPIIKDIRAIKSSYEVELLREACRVSDQAFLEVPSFLREGMLEIELASLFEAAMRRGGLCGCSKMRTFNQDFFLGNTCVGANGIVPSFFDGPVGGSGLTPAYPHGAGRRVVQRNEIVYIDYTCVVNGYTGDQARMFCIGELSPKMIKAFEDAVYIEQEIVKMMKPGIPAEQPYLLAVQMAEEMGYKDNFLGYKEDQVKFVGHGVGLELDEWPILAKGMKMPVIPGMTFALEPKFVFPEGAIGIENTYVMTEDGLERLGTLPETITYVD